MSHIPEDCDGALNGLAADGYAVIDAALPDVLVAALIARARQLHAADELTRAGVGRDADNMQVRAVRRDLTQWLTGNHPDEAHYLAIMEALRLRLNQALFLGLFSFEAHFAVYQDGAFYARHLDAFRGARNRIVSTVLYLNPDWHHGDGGELVLHQPDRAVIVEPVANRLVLFLSEETPHEVLAAVRPRYSIAGWFRLNEGLSASAALAG